MVLSSNIENTNTNILTIFFKINSRQTWRFSSFLIPILTRGMQYYANNNMTISHSEGYFIVFDDNW